MGKKTVKSTRRPVARAQFRERCPNCKQPVKYERTNYREGSAYISVSCKNGHWWCPPSPRRMPKRVRVKRRKTITKKCCKAAYLQGLTNGFVTGGLTGMCIKGIAGLRDPDILKGTIYDEDDG